MIDTIELLALRTTDPEVYAGLADALETAEQPGHSRQFSAGLFLDAHAAAFAHGVLETEEQYLPTDGRAEDEAKALWAGFDRVAAAVRNGLQAGRLVAKYALQRTAHES